jgi:hypothetical protein
MYAPERYPRMRRHVTNRPWTLDDLLMEEPSQKTATSFLRATFGRKYNFVIVRSVAQLSCTLQRLRTLRPGWQSTGFLQRVVRYRGQVDSLSGWERFSAVTLIWH